jgi:hypothetical protein
MNPQKPATSTPRPGGANVVSLTCHVNTREKRLSQDIRDSLIQAVRHQHSEKRITGAVVALFGTDGKITFVIDPGDHNEITILRMTTEIMGSMLHDALVSEVVKHAPNADVEDQQT